MSEGETSSRSLHVVQIVADGCSGTGCVVGPDLVLTALHIVWPDFDAGGTLASEIRAGGNEADLVWPSHGNVGKDSLDAALLRWRDSVRTSHAEVDGVWSDGARYRSFGFAGSVEGDSWVDLQGGTLPHASRTDMGHVTSVQRPVSSEDWSGVSGAPVLVGDQVRGVVVLRQSNWPQKLDVVLARALLRDPAFGKLVPPDRRRPLITVIDELAKREGVREALKAQPPHSVESMTDLPCTESLTWVAAAHGDALKMVLSDGIEAKRTVCADLFRLARLLAAYHGPVVWREEDGLCHVTAISSAGVELARARRDGTIAQFVPVEAVERMPSPRDELRVGPGPDVGPSSDAGEMVHRHLCEKFGWPDATKPQVDAWLGALRRSAEQHARHYFVHFGPETSQRPGFDASLRALTKLYRNLPVFRRHDPEADSEELAGLLILNSISVAQQKLERA
ncbi:MAG: hypothetical protein R3F56_08725 [Planctomycetota bacterium]